MTFIVTCEICLDLTLNIYLVGVESESGNGICFAMRLMWHLKGQLPKNKNDHNLLSLTTEDI